MGSSFVHAKVSIKPDSADPSIIQPSDWNATHVLNPPLTGITYSSPAGFSALPLGSQGQYLRRKFNTPVLEYEFANPQVFSALDHNFTVTVAQTLSGGVPSVIVLPYAIKGINTLSPGKHYLRIVDGVGGNEAVLVTSVAGNNIGFTPTLNHTSGNWTLTSATSGVQEAAYDMGTTTGGGIVFFDSSVYTAYQKVFLKGFGGSHVTLQGTGAIASRYERDASYPSGHLFHWEGATAPGFLTVADLQVTNTSGAFNNTGGSAFYLDTSNSDRLYFYNVHVLNGYNLVTVTGLGHITALNSRFEILYTYNYATDHLWIQSTPFGLIDQTNVQNSSQLTASKAAIKFTRCDGFIVTNSIISGYWGILVENDPAFIFNFLYIENNILDTIEQFGIIFRDGGAHNAVYEQIRIANNHICQNTLGGHVSPNDSVGVAFQNDPRGVIILGNNIKGWKGSGMAFQVTNRVPKNCLVSNNIISNNNTGNTNGYGLVIAPDSAHTNNIICNNTISNSGSSTVSYQQVGIYFVSGGIFRGYSIYGNDVTNNVTAGFLGDPGQTYSGMNIYGNLGANNIFPFIASAASINVDLGKSNIIITGTTTISTITGSWDGRVIVFQKLDAGSLTFTTGGNIVNAKTITQYGTVVATFNLLLGNWVLT